MRSRVDVFLVEADVGEGDGMGWEGMADASVSSSARVNEWVNGRERHCRVYVQWLDRAYGLLSLARVLSVDRCLLVMYRSML